MPALLQERKATSVQTGTTNRRWWRGHSAFLIILFNVLLTLWLILKPASPALVLAVDNVAQFVGPLLVIPLCFGGLLRRARHGAPAASAMGSRRWAPVLLGLGVLGIALGQMIYTFYEQILHYATAPFPGWSDACWLSVYPFLLLGILLLPAQP